ncbi:HNH endonuclease [Paenibacillus sp. CC-CFT747]|nr:HNH endonuclease [Paenibacillus sp. CC-CFT747]
MAGIKDNQLSFKGKPISRLDLIDEIIIMAEAMNITNIQGWDVTSEDKASLIASKLSAGQLMSVADELLWIEEERLENVEVESVPEGAYINPLEIVERYKNGDRSTKNLFEITAHSIEWRHLVPSFIKPLIPTWNVDTITIFYEKCKKVLLMSSGKQATKVRILISNLSELLYEEGKEQTDKDMEIDITDDDNIAELVMFRVESIILPHVEVIEKIEKSRGKIIFCDIWDLPFTESLKKEVKERDQWKCAVCESESDLHVHHKIPRKLGGVHHPDNLVTLCASCHASVESAHLKKHL